LRLPRCAQLILAVHELNLFATVNGGPPPTDRCRADRFRVRECYLPVMLSYLHPELRHMIRTRPLVSVAVDRDRYSVGYSPPGTAVHALLVLNCRRDHIPAQTARPRAGTEGCSGKPKRAWVAVPGCCRRRRVRVRTQSIRSRQPVSAQPLTRHNRHYGGLAVQALLRPRPNRC
jgi:hypothetical protein